MINNPQLSRYIAIVKIFKEKKALTFDELKNQIYKRIDCEGIKDFVHRTFQRDIKSIELIFKAYIEFDRNLNKYILLENDNSEIINEIIQSYQMFNFLIQNDEISKYIHLQKEETIGFDNISILYKAIKTRKLIEFQYCKFDTEEVSQRKMEPYILKEHNNRWYIVGKDIHVKAIRTFGIDRITDLEITNIKYTYPSDFDAKKLFEYSIGITYHDNKEPEEVILSFDYTQGKYIKSKPLHHSQTILIDNDDELNVKLNVHITHDLIMTILSMGDCVTVIEPKSLVSDIKSTLQSALNLYK